jgi:hypothetical protein
MTQEEILQYNKRCAEFLGYKNTTPDDKDFNIYQSEKGMIIGNKIYTLLETMSMRFHSDWNWIMEVVEAIEKKAWVNIKGCAVDISTIVNLNAPTKKEAVVQAINQFLIWYEQNKTK